MPRPGDDARTDTVRSVRPFVTRPVLSVSAGLVTAWQGCIRSLLGQGLTSQAGRMIDSLIVASPIQSTFKALLQSVRVSCDIMTSVGSFWVCAQGQFDAGDIDDIRPGTRT